MASVALLAVFLLSGSFPARAQDTRTDQAGSVLREYVDKGYCTYTYVVPPGSRTEGCTPPGLEPQLAETEEETTRLKNQVERLSSLVDTLLPRLDSLSAELSKEKVKSAQMVQNLTRELQEQQIRLLTRLQEQKTSQQGQIGSLSDQLSEERVRSAELKQNFTRKLQEQETRLQTQVQNLAQELQEQETRLQTQVQNLTQELQEQNTSFWTQTVSLSNQLLEEKGMSVRLEQNLTRKLEEQETRIRARLQNLTQELQERKTSQRDQVDSMSYQLSEERARSAELEQNLTQELQEQETRLLTQLQNLSDELSKEKNRGDRQERNMTQTLLLQETKFIGILNSLSDELSEERDRNRGLVTNLSQVQLQLDNITSILYEHNVTIHQRLQCPCEKSVPTETIPPTKATSPLPSASKTEVSTSAKASSNHPVVSTTHVVSPTQSVSTTAAGPKSTTTATRTLTTRPTISSDVITEYAAKSVSGIQIRLASGLTPLEGRVEVRNGTGQWGSVCDDNFDLQDAHVVCRQLGFGAALEVKLAGHFGEGSGNVWLDEVACRGNETDLGDCPADSWGRSDCSHKEDVGVVCAGDAALRLVGGPVPWKGRLQIRPRAALEWGAVCNTGWTEAEAGFVCRQMGYTGGVTSSGQADIGEGSENIWLGDVTCSGDETHILLCGFSWEPSDCHHSQDVQLVCTGGVSVRLIGSRVEVRSGNGELDWGTVCDDGFDDRDAQVFCRQLGYRGGVTTAGGNTGDGAGLIRLGILDCVGNESSVADCEINRWGNHDCSHKKTAGVMCTDDVSVRLNGSQSPLQGRVEIRPKHGDWGTICDDGFDDRDAQVVCRQLGYRGGVATAGGDFGEGTGNIWLRNLNCFGNESSLEGCLIQNSNSRDCVHMQDVGVVCKGDVSVRLTGGQSSSEGRVEVRPGNGDWGTVCDDGFDDRDAHVVCRQLGYQGGVARVGGSFPEGTGNIWLDNLNCAGNESSVADCEINRWGDHDCTHKEDAGVVCGDAAEEDCAGYYSSGRTSGVYPIGLLPADVQAYCDMNTTGGGWTVIQRRQDGSVPFNRTWEEYKLGFGNKNGEYWLGNENIHLLTNQKNYRLRIDLVDWNNESVYAEYSTFRVSGESDGYRLHISGYSGTAGDSITFYDNGYMFSTVDRDNDGWAGHCSQQHGQGGWWFGSGCGHSFLNGRYLGNCGNSCPALQGANAQGLMWVLWRGGRYSLKYVSMKIRP
uniref:Soluble scavenger receptor cysteine-rich domain-containing protein SSC5D n=1 Tax=Branchiostoma floridae TaxID=7739 RepID=C3ZQ40_BRAFL|eukprot:XP_002589408.1 hypothetical protein BRAFLDRAFT_77852 [Branchiostoma floridae]